MIRIASALQHELGHFFGLAHPDDNPNGPCASSGGGVSDGCDGELMCRAVQTNRSPHLTHGDAYGLRKFWQAGTYHNRRVMIGNRALGSHSTTIRRLGSSDQPATFLPRIGCAGVGNGLAQCAVVAVQGQVDTGGPASGQQATIYSLSNFDSTNGFSVTALPPVTTHAQFPMDIALNGTGNEAYLTYVSQTNNIVYVWFVNMLSGFVSSFPMGYRAALPVRVSFDEDRDAAIIVGAVQERPPIWRADEVSFNPATLVWTKTPINFGNMDDLPFTNNNFERGNRLIASDYDFDCKYTVGDTDLCTLVAVLHDDTSTTNDVGNLFSRQFSVGGSPLTAFMDSSWTLSGPETAQAVIGVAVTSRLVVSQGRRSGTTSAANSRQLEYNMFTGNVNPNDYLSSFTYTSDGDPCHSWSADGFLMGAATPNGGNSIAFCAACGSSGAIQSIHFGAEINNANGFCY